MTVQKINSDKLGIEHVGKYIVIQKRYEMPNSRPASSLIIGLLFSVTHELDATAAVATTIRIVLAPEDDFEVEVNGSNVYLADTLHELLIEVASLVTPAAETSAEALN